MSDVLSFNPSRALDANAVNSPGALAYFYDAGTTTLRTVYADSALTVPHASPLVADAAGVFAAVYAGGAAVKAVVQTSAGATLYTLDPCVKVPSSGAGASSVSFAPTVDIPVNNVQSAIERVQANIVAPLAAFGLGVTGSVALLVSIDATNIASGTYRFDNTTTGTFPSGVAAVDTGAIHLVRETAGSAWMYLYHDTTDRLYFRRMTASVWGSWREVPTGATSIGNSLVQAINAAAARTVIDFPAGLNATGSAPIYACRAWVNFNGTGTVAIRGSGNVSSITDNGIGDYTVNFTTAMPDANYGVKLARGSDNGHYAINLSSMSATSVRVQCRNSANGTAGDETFVFVEITR